MKQQSLLYSWIICAGCTLVIFCTGLAITGFTVYQPYLISIGGLTNTQSSMIIMIRNLFTLVGMLMVDQYLKKTGIRLGLMLSTLCLGLSFGLYALANSFPTYMLAAALSGIPYGIGGMVPVSILISKWFRANRSFALGICAAGSGLSAVVATPIITYIVENYTLGTAFIIEAVFILLAALVVLAMIRNEPNEAQAAVLLSQEVGDSHKVKVAPAVTIPRYQIIIFVVAILLMGATMNASSNLGVLYTNQGMSASSVSFLIALLGGTLLVGKCLYGFCADHLGTYKTGLLFFSFLVGGMILCTLADMTGLITASMAMILLGLGFPMESVGLSVIASDVASQEDYPVMVKRFQFTFMLGSVVFGPVPGAIADWTGSYIPAYILIAILALLSALMIQFQLRANLKTKPLEA